MPKKQLKHYLLVSIPVIGLCCLSVLRADTFSDMAAGNTTAASTGGLGQTSSNVDTAAYDALTQAQASAVASNQIADDMNTKDDMQKRIAANTYAFLKAFNAYALNWLQIYTAPSSTELGSMFGQYMDNVQTNTTKQASYISSTGGSLYLLDDPARAIYKMPLPTPDISYATLLKQPGGASQASDEIKFYSKEFIKNASGLNIPHLSPASIPAGGDPNAVAAYRTFYNTISSIANYDAYILSAHAADVENNYKLSQIQTDLKNYATNNKWLAHVNEEQSIGVILRQLLLFTSQMYVISLQSLETQKQLLAAIAMTNSLVILGNGYYEGTLVDKTKPKGRPA